MQLTRTADHALRAVLFLAQEEGDVPVPAQRIAEALGAPANYLSKTLHQLARAGIVRGHRGPAGGFTLSVAAEDLSVAAVIEAFEDHGKRTVCLLGDRPCTDREPCAAHAAWTAIVGNARGPLRSTSIADLLAGRARLEP